MTNVELIKLREQCRIRTDSLLSIINEKYETDSYEGELNNNSIDVPFLNRIANLGHL